MGSHDRQGWILIPTAPLLKSWADTKSKSGSVRSATHPHTRRDPSCPTCSLPQKSVTLYTISSCSNSACEKLHAGWAGITAPSAVKFNEMDPLSQAGYIGMKVPSNERRQGVRSCHLPSPCGSLSA